MKFKPVYLLLMSSMTTSLFFFQNCRINQGFESANMVGSVDHDSKSDETSDEGTGGDSIMSSDPGTGTTGQTGQSTDLIAKSAPGFPKVDVWPPPIDYGEFNSTGCAGPLIGSSRTLNVGPGQTYAELTDVPWLSLGAGDVVNIYYRDIAYKTKFGIISVANAQKPFIINGVTNSSCLKPVLDGQGAVTATDARAMNFGSDIQESGLITIHRPPNTTGTHKAKYIIIQNLKIVNVRSGSTFKNNMNSIQSYGIFSAAIYSPRVDYLYIKNCEFLNNAQALFTNSKGGSEIDFSSYLILRGNYVDGSGYNDDDHEHGAYTQGYRTLIEGNYFGRAQGGSSVKDRSSATVFRYNKVDVSARGLDLVETEEEYFNNVKSDPLYHHAWVYGNLFTNDNSSPNGFSIRMIHWGFDNSSAHARTGTLYFYNNTILNKGTDPTGSYWYASVFQMGSGGYNADNPSNYQINAWENVFTNEAISTGYGKVEFRLLWDLGKVNFFGTNYLTSNWKRPTDGVLIENSSSIIESSAGVIDHGSLSPLLGSPILNKGITYNPTFSAHTGISGFSATNLLHNSEFAMGSNRIPYIKAKFLSGLRDLGALEK
tara:strand:+ start:1108 stop:2898 length:1791 start_codon:yes stop_codon:yes gene_type:complete